MSWIDDPGQMRLHDSMYAAARELAASAIRIAERRGQEIEQLRAEKRTVGRKLGKTMKGHPK